MQTFLPYKNFEESVKSLDYRRLGKQRVEAMQILNVLTGVQTTNGWRNHPAVTMWIGYEDALKLYHDYCILEWISRGYKNNMELKILRTETDYLINSIEYPWWLGDEPFHRAMRARLIEKDKAFYLPKFPNDEGFNDGKYFWPVNETNTFKMI